MQKIVLGDSLGNKFSFSVFRGIMMRIRLTLFAIVLGMTFVGGGGYMLYGRSIEGTVQRQGSSCPPNAPISVTIRNWTPFPIHRTDFKMQAWSGRNTKNLLIESQYGYNTQLKVDPFSSETFCYSDAFFAAPVEPANEAESAGRIRIDTQAEIAQMNWLRDKVRDVEIHVYGANYVELK
ncbi:MAG: hypothetical protein ABID63_00060 [Pseudomonadota bacterium]